MPKFRCFLKYIPEYESQIGNEGQPEEEDSDNEEESSTEETSKGSGESQHKIFKSSCQSLSMNAKKGADPYIQVCVDTQKLVNVLTAGQIVGGGGGWLPAVINRQNLAHAILTQLYAVVAAIPVPGFSYHASSMTFQILNQPNISKFIEAARQFNDDPAFALVINPNKPIFILQLDEEMFHVSIKYNHPGVFQ